jgi:hypothetical protein
MRPLLTTTSSSVSPLQPPVTSTPAPCTRRYSWVLADALLALLGDACAWHKPALIDWSPACSPKKSTVCAPCSRHGARLPWRSGQLIRVSGDILGDAERPPALLVCLGYSFCPVLASWCCSSQLQRGHGFKPHRGDVPLSAAPRHRPCTTLQEAAGEAVCFAPLAPAINCITPTPPRHHPAGSGSRTRTGCRRSGCGPTSSSWRWGCSTCTTTTCCTGTSSRRWDVSGWGRAWDPPLQ